MSHSLYNNQSQTRTLGRGLSSLIPNREQKNSVAIGPVAEASYFLKTKAGVLNQILHIPPSKIHTNPYQPRKKFKETELENLENSIRQYGIIQPLIVTQTMGGKYELVAGERRLRAAIALNLNLVPVIVRTARELEKLELSLVENVQREDLNPMEKAAAYKQLIDNFSLTQEVAAKRLGIARSTLNNSLRLLNLSEDIQLAVVDGKISEGQAKLMLAVSEIEQKKIFNKTHSGNLTVKDIEQEVRKLRIRPHMRTVKKDPQIKNWENKLQQILGTRVSIRKRGEAGGLVEIEYYSDEELRGIVENILK